MRTLAICVGIALLVLGRADAQPAPEAGENTGFIGGRGPDIPKLEIDDCPQLDPAMDAAQRNSRGRERYERGETLYIQGDYEGAVKEFVGAYCLASYYTILKDIGQAYERKLDYERAIGYLRKYLERMPPNATKLTPCAAEPREDFENVTRRITVLENLSAQINVQTDIEKGKVTIENEVRVVARGDSGDTLSVPGGTYNLTVKLDGYVPFTKKIVVKIGKPYTVFAPMVKQKGSLRLEVTPEDARVTIDGKLETFGHFVKDLDRGPHTISADAPGWVGETHTIDILPERTNELHVDLAPQPQFGRRQLVAYATLGAGYATGALLFAFNNTGIAGTGSLIGAAAGFAGSYFYLSEGVELGTSNLTITTSVATAIAGFTAASLFTGDDVIRQPIVGATLVLGAGAGYYLGRRLHIKPGDAALMNSSLLWGTAAGFAFSASFDPGRRVSSGLVLSGLGMGAISGVLLTRYFDVSRTRAVLIDVGGLAGIIGGLAADSVINPPQASGTDQQAVTNRDREHLANYALAGMAVGLVTAGILTRNFDAPAIPLKASLGQVVDAGGRSTTTYGLSAAW